MVNDDNDKWSDNAELPINPTYSSESSEDGQLEEKPKRKTLNGRSNDQKELHINSTYSSEEPEQLEEKPKRKTLNGRYDDQKELSMEELMNSSSNDQKVLSMEELMNGSVHKEEPIRNMTKNGKSKGSKEEPKKKSKEESTLSKTDDSTKPESKDLIQDNQELKEKLVKLKEENKELKDIKEPSYLKDLTKYIKNLDSTIEQLATDLRQFTDAKSWEAISKGTLDVRRYANYYDVADTIETAGASDPNDFDSTVYNVERVFEYLERYAEIMYVANDGTDNLYVIVSHGGRTRFSQEAPIYPGEVKCYFNVYEIRLRSPTAGLAYRVTEYCINNISEISSIPIEKANLHNQALPAANTNWLSSDITATNTPTTFMIEVAVSVAGNFRAVVTNSGNAQTVIFNAVSGPALVAGGVYIFNLLVHSGDTVNFTYSVTGGVIQIFRVQELDSASA